MLTPTSSEPILGEVSSIQSPFPEPVVEPRFKPTTLSPYAFLTPAFHGYAVEFSPFNSSVLALASSSNYGLSGNGRVWIFKFNMTTKAYTPIKQFETLDAVFDVAWNESNENQLISANGDGSIMLWDISIHEKPIATFPAHQRETLSVRWNSLLKDQFVSSSWDSLIKLWNPHRSIPISTLKGHTSCVFAAIPSPTHPHLLASGSSDQTIRIWDQRLPVHVLHFHHHDVLTLDWDKYQPYFYSGSADRSIFQMDLRKPSQPLSQVTTTLPIRRLKTSPHASQHLACVGYSHGIYYWHMGLPRSELVWYTNEVHTEFILGIDLSLHVPGLMATYGWDSKVALHELPT